MDTLNKVMIIGNVGADSEMHFSRDGKVASFRVATNHVYSTPDGNRIQETEWFTVIAFGKLTEQCKQLLCKGQLVYVEGRLHTRKWDDEKGQRRYRTEIVADRVIFLDRKSSLITEDRSGKVRCDELDQELASSGI